ncbi:MAG: hypothetical protein ABS916_03745 [Carnobacterium sp.]|uniref:hypothetical protein n=1 Tax=Carnobacterium sp. TaxID=48221 RepID=UPI0033156A19
MIKSNKELAVELVVAMLEHNSVLKYQTGKNVADFVQPSSIEDALKKFTNTLDEL